MNSTPQPERLTYTRHASVPGGDDVIVSRAWYRFLIIMLVIGGSAILLWIFFGGVKRGETRIIQESAAQQQSIPGMPTAPPATPPPTQPMKIQVDATINLKTTEPVTIPSREISDAERRNEALKERLRRRYGISQ